MDSRRPRVVLLNEEFIIDKYTKAKDDGEYGLGLINEYLEKKDSLYIIKRYGKLFAYIVERLSSICYDAEDILTCMSDYYHYFVKQDTEVVMFPQILECEHIEFDYIRDYLCDYTLPVENDYLDSVLDSLSTNSITLDEVLNTLLGSNVNETNNIISIKAIFKYITDFNTISVCGGYDTTMISECIMMHSNIERSVKVQYTIGIILYLLLNSIGFNEIVRYLDDNYSLSVGTFEVSNDDVSCSTPSCAFKELDLLAKMADSFGK